jgi:hypothetical protein
MWPSAIKGASTPVTSSSQNGTSMACHSSARKFGIAAARWTAAIVPIGLPTQ